MPEARPAEMAASHKPSASRLVIDVALVMLGRTPVSSLTVVW